MIPPGRNEDQKRTNNQRQTQFPGIQVRGAGGTLDQPSIASALKSFIDNSRKNEMQKISINCSQNTFPEMDFSHTPMPVHEISSEVVHMLC